MLRKKKSFSEGSLIVLICWALIMSPILDAVNDAMAQPQDKCEKELREADQNYRIGRFNESIDLLTRCLNKKAVSKEEKMRAYRLLGLAFIAKDYEKQARNAVTKLLELVPNYESDPIQDPPPFTKLVEEVREQIQTPAVEQPPKLVVPPVRQEKKGGGMKWLLIGGVGLVAGGVVAFLVSGGDGPNPLPVPPDLPGRP